MRRGRLGRYALWQVRDYVMDRGLPTVIVALLLGYITAADMLRRAHAQVEMMPQKLVDQYGSLEAARIPLLQQVNESFLGQFMGPIVYIGTLLALNGVVANDRNKGYYRFLFAKPVSPLRYYGQLFLVHWLCFLFTLSVLALLYGAIVLPIISTSLLVAAAAMFLLYGGVMFLFSVLARADWLLLLLFTAASTALWGWFGKSASPLAALLYLLPPLNRTEEVYGAVARHRALDGALLSWYAAYGLLCVIAALFALRRRRMAVE